MLFLFKHVLLVFFIFLDDRKFNFFIVSLSLGIVLFRLICCNLDLTVEGRVGIVRIYLF